MAGGASVKVTGLQALVRELRGPAFKDVNAELRRFSRLIAADIAPKVSEQVARGTAPQADAVARTVRPHSDRVPVVVVGKTNPPFRSGFGHKGESSGHRKLRRGSLARGVVAGPKGGHRHTRALENYYRPQGRDPSWGRLGAALRTGGIITNAGEDLYLRFYIATLKAHGFDVHKGAR